MCEMLIYVTIPGIHGKVIAWVSEVQVKLRPLFASDAATNANVFLSLFKEEVSSQRLMVKRVFSRHMSAFIQLSVDWMFNYGMKIPLTRFNHTLPNSLQKKTRMELVNCPNWSTGHKPYLISLQTGIPMKIILFHMLQYIKRGIWLAWNLLWKGWLFA